MKVIKTVGLAKAIRFNVGGALSQVQKHGWSWMLLGGRSATLLIDEPVAGMTAQEPSAPRELLTSLAGEPHRDCGRE